MPGDAMCGAPPAVPRRVGLLAGWGRYPWVVAEALRAQGSEVYCAGVKDHADPRLAQVCTAFDWVGLAQLGKARRFFRRHGVLELTMAGKIHKIELLRPWAYWKHRPDWRGLCRFWSFGVSKRMDGRDDTLLAAVIAEFCLDGGVFRPATDFAPELLAELGTLTRRHPTAAEQSDIEFGWRLAKEMGRLDVGQSVAVRNQAVLAVEAIEGTDACIRRAGELAHGARFTVVKVAKPQQDMRFDVPTIGVGTLESMLAAGAGVLAIEAGKTILLDQQAVLALADRERLVIVALDAAGSGAHGQSPAEAA